MCKQLTKLGTPCKQKAIVIDGKEQDYCSIHRPKEAPKEAPEPKEVPEPQTPVETKKVVNKKKIKKIIYFKSEDAYKQALPLISDLIYS